MKKLIPTNAGWKIFYEEIFRNTPKQQRRTKYNIKCLRSRAKWIENILNYSNLDEAGESRL